MDIISLREGNDRSNRVALLLCVNAHTRKELQAQCEQAVSSVWSALWLVAVASDSDVAATVSIGANARLSPRLAGLNIDVTASAQGIELVAGIAVKAFGHQEWEFPFETASNFTDSCLGYVAGSWNECAKRSAAYQTLRTVRGNIIRAG